MTPEDHFMCVTQRSVFTTIDDSGTTICAIDKGRMMDTVTNCCIKKSLTALVDVTDKIKPLKYLRSYTIVYIYTGVVFNVTHMGTTRNARKRRSMHTWPMGAVACFMKGKPQCGRCRPTLF